MKPAKFHNGAEGDVLSHTKTGTPQMTPASQVLQSASQQQEQLGGVLAAIGVVIFRLPFLNSLDFGQRKDHNICFSKQNEPTR